MLLLPDVKCKVLLYREPDDPPVNSDPVDDSEALDQESEYESLMSVSSTINQTASDMKLIMIKGECKELEDCYSTASI